MKTIVKIEEALLFLFAIWLFSQLELSIWWTLLMLLAPDIGMLGYLVNTKVGAFTYNLLHHKGIAIGLYVFGFILAAPIVQATGLILFGHSSLDRAFGYGLKFGDSFQRTHLGWIGQQKSST